MGLHFPHGYTRTRHLSISYPFWQTANGKQQRPAGNPRHGSGGCRPSARVSHRRGIETFLYIGISWRSFDTHTQNFMSSYTRTTDLMVARGIVYKGRGRVVHGRTSTQGCTRMGKLYTDAFFQKFAGRGWPRGPWHALELSSHELAWWVRTGWSSSDGRANLGSTY